MSTRQLPHAHTGTVGKAGDPRPAQRRPFISVGVPTCNRPDDLARLLDSLARVRYPHWELLLIDQSDGDEAWQAAAAYGALIQEIRYLRLDEKNASAARNLAIEHARGEILALVDDDCTVTPDWLDRVSEAFEQDREVDLVFGAVEAAPNDPKVTMVPSYKPRRQRRISGRLAAVRMGGIGASLYLRLGSPRLPRFDVCLGPGSRFRSSEDWDFRYRVAASGLLIGETPRISVLHHGGRSYAGGAASALVRDYLYGLGAAHMKLLRSGDGIMVGAILGKLAESIWAIRPLNAFSQRATRVGGLLMYLRGLRDSFRVTLDRQERLYRLPAATGAAMFITVAIPTCNRPRELGDCLSSLSQVDSTDWKLFVVDQSDDDHSRRVVEAWKPHLPPVVYLRLQEKNASAARNLAIESAASGVLAFLDDDCTVSPDWLDRVREAFDHAPDASLIFGAVTAAGHDPASTFVPAYEPRRERRLRGPSGELNAQGMGASMSLRLGPGTRPRFDLRLGPGARFRSSQDVDYTFRALAAGETVVETPRIAVVHHGARSYAEGAGSIKWRDYLYGAGACHVKLLRCGQWIMVATIARIMARSIGAIRPHNVLRHRPTHFGLVQMYTQGLRDGLQAPIDRKHSVFL